MRKVILFDMDGTLTESGEGITKSVQYGTGTERISAFAVNGRCQIIEWVYYNKCLKNLIM